MARKLEQYTPLLAEAGELRTAKPVVFESTLAVTGVVTFTAAPVFSVIPAGIGSPTVKSAAVGATVVVTAAQSGGTFQNASTSGSPSWTLPAAANGLEYTFTCANTTAGFTVTAAGTIHAKTSASGTAVSGTTLTNTQATAVVGDSITLVCDGTAWWVTAQTGIFTAA